MALAHKTLEEKIELIGRDNLEAMLGLTAKHLATPQVSIQDHKDNLFKDVNSFVCPRKKIYLDTNFWVELRDVDMGRSKNGSFQALYEALLSHVKSGRFICPVSAEGLTELTRQKDAVTRRAMSRVMDLLSAGTCIRTHQERTNLEAKEAVLRFIANSGIPSTTGFQRAKDAVWTKVPFVFGLFIPSTPVLPEPMGKANAKATLDFLHSRSIEQVMDILSKLRGDFVFGDMDYEAFAAKLNSDKKKFEHENRSSRQILKAELQGTLDGVLPEIRKALGELFIGIEFQGKVLKDGDVESLAMPVAQGLYAGYIRGRFKDIIPSVVIPSHLHAAIRWDRQRKYHPNDFNDVLHTSAALGYYDYFFSEGPFKALAESCKLDRQYSVKIFTDPAKCMEVFNVTNFS